MRVERDERRAHAASEQARRRAAQADAALVNVLDRRRLALAGRGLAVPRCRSA